MGIDTVSARRAQELERLNADLIREIERLRMETSSQQAKIQELEYFRNQIREGETGDILINLTNVNLRLKQQVDKLETLRKVLETENADLRNEKVLLQQENERMRAQLSNHETEMRYLRQRLAEKDSLLMICMNRKSSIPQTDPADQQQGNRNQEPAKEAPGNNTPAGISADEIRRLQEQERQLQSENNQRGKISDKPEKPEKPKRKGGIPPPIIID
jgi:hypothetical protein